MNMSYIDNLLITAVKYIIDQRSNCKCRMQSLHSFNALITFYVCDKSMRAIDLYLLHPLSSP